MNLTLLAALLAAAPTPPGVTVAHSPAASKRYIGSPSLAVLPTGEYLASHDFFMAGDTGDTTDVYASRDRGRTWTKRATVVGQWWSTLFVHRGAVYLMGTSKAKGLCVIRRSTDAGTTWTTPTDDKSGLLLTDGLFHCAPVPVLAHGGRLWRAMEVCGPTWDRKFRAFVLSAPDDADLLHAASWTSTNRLPGEPTWLNGTFNTWLEGNAVAAPDGGVVNILRVQQPDMNEVAAVVRVSADSKTATFDPADGFIKLPGGSKKFTIRFDPESKRYWTLANVITPDARKAAKRPDAVRNTLALISSADWKGWETRRVIVSHPDVSKHGFQYPDWQFDGPDLIAVVRTAFEEPDGTAAHSAHDANWLTFHRVERFRGE